MPTLQRRARPNGHAHKSDLAPAGAQCPTCDSSISAEKLGQIQGTLRAHDAAIERAVEERFAREIARIDADRKADIAKAVREAVETAEAKLKLAREQQAGAVAAAVKAERASAGKKLTSATRAAKAAKQQAKKLAAERDTVIKRQIEAERDSGAKRLDAALQAAKLEHATEKLRLETALADLTRRVQAKPPHAVGAPAEKSLYEQIAAVLAETAPLDIVERVAPGVKGGDVTVSVVHPDTKQTVGRILVESKQVSRWNSTYTRTLRENQLRANAAYAVLSTNLLPPKCRELAVIDDVILSTPERVPMLIALLRRVLIDNHVARLGATARTQKAERLFAFVQSPVCDNLFSKLLRLGRDLAALDAAEMKSHEKVFSKRSALIQGIMDMRDAFVTTVAAIVAGVAPSPTR